MSSTSEPIDSGVLRRAYSPGTLINVSNLNYKFFWISMSSKAPSLPRHRIITRATLITGMRIVLTPFIVMCIIAQSWGIALVLFLCAGLTDALDGLVARWCNEVTLFGACLDPVADKLLMLTTFGALTFVSCTNVPLWFFVVLLCKEVMQVGSVVVLYLAGYHVIPRPTLLGKLTTSLQIIFVLALIASYVFDYTCAQDILYIPLIVLVGMSILSYVQYVVVWYKQQKTITQV